MTQTERVSLLDARLELTRHMTNDERSELAGVSLPVITADPGPLELNALLTTHHAFGATVLDGIVVNTLRVGEQSGIQLLGPGDLLVPGSDLWPEWLAAVELQTATEVRLGLFGNELLAAAYRWPRVVQGLYMCIGDQLQRLTAQLVICQLPRVEDRLLAMMWLLSDSWGQVTSGGVRLPLALTHETLGAMIGARRPTVTLALRRLTEDGAIVHQDSGWLLVQSPPPPAGARPRILPSEIPKASLDEWGAPEPAPDPSVGYAELRAIVRHLREQHILEREQTRQRLSDARSARLRMSAIRKRIEEEAVRRRRPPSS
jgi:CRP/FNR family cyclic AMP-dependent transcriptional regulator